jgi:hypothetical protein
MSQYAYYLFLLLHNDLVYKCAIRIDVNDLSPLAKDLGLEVMWYNERATLEAMIPEYMREDHKLVGVEKIDDIFVL